MSIRTVIGELNSILRGWVGYFARGAIKKYLERLMGWIRRRIRQYLWKQWRNGENRKHRLRQLGVEEGELGSNSYWKMAGIMNHLIGNESLHAHYGLVDTLGHYNKLHAKRMEQDGIVLDYRYNSLFGRTAVCRTACTVV